MKHSNLTSLLTSNFPHQPTSDQLNVINVLTRFLLTEATHPTLIIRGYAGTGKTSLVNTIVKSLSEIKKHFVLLAPTGRAAKVMMNYTQSLATTIHKKIYYSDNQNGEFGGFSLQRNMHKHTTFIVDEASMIGGDNFDFNYGASNLLDDLLSFIFSGENCQLIIIGDSAQLPPVGTAISPALNKSYLNAHFGLNIGQVELTEVVRQNKDSGILFNATNIRMQLHANNNSFPQINLNFPDIFAITGMELEEELDQAFSKFGDEDVIVLCRSNKRANLFNQQIRARIKWYEEELCAGDRLMSVKNNYFWLDQTSKAGFIANGDAISISTVKSIEHKYGFDFANVIVELCDYEDEPNIEIKILLNTIHVEAPALSITELKKLYQAIEIEEYAHVKYKKDRHQKIMKNPYYNALQVKFAYAVTCHKSQGGQWSAVFVEQGFLTEDMINSEYLRWLYTAVTRATDKLYFVNFHPKFISNQETSY